MTHTHTSELTTWFVQHLTAADVTSAGRLVCVWYFSAHKADQWCDSQCLKKSWIDHFLQTESPVWCFQWEKSNKEEKEWTNGFRRERESDCEVQIYVTMSSEPRVTWFIQSAESAVQQSNTTISSSKVTEVKPPACRVTFIICGADKNDSVTCFLQLIVL